MNIDCLHPAEPHCDEIAEWKCAYPNCDTIVGLYHNLTNELYLGVRRRIGDLGDATEQRWLSQVQSPTVAMERGCRSWWKNHKVDEPWLGGMMS